VNYFPFLEELPWLWPVEMRRAASRLTPGPLHRPPERITFDQPSARIRQPYQGGGKCFVQGFGSQF
jgi:hypothetical protein